MGFILTYLIFYYEKHRRSGVSNSSICLYFSLSFFLPSLFSPLPETPRTAHSTWSALRSTLWQAWLSLIPWDIQLCSRWAQHLQPITSQQLPQIYPPETVRKMFPNLSSHKPEMCSQEFCPFCPHGRGSGSIHTHALRSAFPSGLQGGAFIYCAAALGPESDTEPGGMWTDVFWVRLTREHISRWEESERVQSTFCPSHSGCLTIPLKSAKHHSILEHPFSNKSFHSDPCLISFSLTCFNRCIDWLPGNQGSYSWLFLSANLLPFVTLSLLSLPPCPQDWISRGFVLYITISHSLLSFS